MKRVKCYGRMKTNRVETLEKRVLFGYEDAKDPLLDLSFEEGSVPEKGTKKSHRPRKRVNYNENAATPPIFYNSSNVSDSDESKIPIQKKKSKSRKSKKTIKKKTQTVLPYSSENVKEPKWSSISDYSLFIEKFDVENKIQEKATVGNKRHNVFPCIKQSKRSPLAPIQNQTTNGDEPRLSQLSSKVDVSCKDVTNNTVSKEQFVPSTSSLVNQFGFPKNQLEDQLKLSQLSSKVDGSCKETTNNTVSKEQLVSPTSNLTNQSDALKCPLNSNSFNSSAKLSHSGFEMEMNCMDVKDNTSRSTTNEIKQTSIIQDEISSISDSFIEVYPEIFKDRRTFSGEKDKDNIFVQNSTPLVKANIYNHIAELSNISSTVSSILRSNSTLNGKFESTIPSSCRKKFKIVTSTPTVLSKKQNHQRISLLNLSRISAENNCNLFTKMGSHFSRSSVHFQSEIYDNISVSIMQNKTRSLDVQRHSSKLIHKQNHFSKSCLMQSPMSNKSYSCLEKISREKPSSVPCSDINLAQSAIEKLIQLCNQETIEAFETAYDWSHITIRKIGEGTYGEVFKLIQKKKSTVIKIIPVSQDSTNTWLNIETVYSEVKVSQCLSDLRNNNYNKTSNFSKLNSVQFVKGCYPAKLLTAWDTFSTENSSYNIRPDCFDENQLYVILNLEYGGKDMTSFVMKNAVEAESILKQVAISLAIAEETHLFEHRDLHLGNILVQRVRKKAIFYVLRGEKIYLPSQDVMVTIIDFTLSRVFDAGCIYYNNLADDESLFNQSGDYQFEIYRATRDNLKNQWHECSLFSNVLWLKFLCVKMQQYKYSHTSSLKHKKSFDVIAAFEKHLISCKSALDCLKICKVLASIPKSDQSIERSDKVVYLDRKSFQKSKLCIKN